MPILGFLGLSIDELDRGTRQTDGRTDTTRHFIMPISMRCDDVSNMWTMVLVFVLSIILATSDRFGMHSTQYRHLTDLPRLSGRGPAWSYGSNGVGY